MDSPHRTLTFPHSFDSNVLRVTVIHITIHTSELLFVLLNVITVMFCWAFQGWSVFTYEISQFSFQPLTSVVSDLNWKIISVVAHNIQGAAKMSDLFRSAQSCFYAIIILLFCFFPPDWHCLSDASRVTLQSRVITQCLRQQAHPTPNFKSLCWY